MYIYIYILTNHDNTSTGVYNNTDRIYDILKYDETKTEKQTKKDDN